MPVTPRLDLVHNAICAGNFGQIEFKDSFLQRLRTDPDLARFPESRVRLLLHEFVRFNNGQCQCQKESDQHWLQEHPDDPWWYYSIIPVPEFRRGLFVKFKLLWEEGVDEDEAFVQIVSVHEEKEGRIL
jgi:hypothetical protein